MVFFHSAQNFESHAAQKFKWIITMRTYVFHCFVICFSLQTVTSQPCTTDQINAGDLQCDEGTSAGVFCVPADFLCDSEPDCIDFSDEMGCPTPAPTQPPTMNPTLFPTLVAPSHNPTNIPTVSPTQRPTTTPSHSPTSRPTRSPITLAPTNAACPVDEFRCVDGFCIPASFVCDGEPDCIGDEDEVGCTDAPSDAPTDSPSDMPTTAPTPGPTDIPTDIPTTTPSDAPSATPTDVPSSAPSFSPTLAPTTLHPTGTPTRLPTADPTNAPVVSPTRSPTTASPTTITPSSLAPTSPAPTQAAPTTSAPTTTLSPTTVSPTTSAPSTSAPTTNMPTTSVPTTTAPSTRTPTQSPSSAPTSAPTGRTNAPTASPSSNASSVLPLRGSVAVTSGQVYSPSALTYIDADTYAQRVTFFSSSTGAVRVSLPPLLTVTSASATTVSPGATSLEGILQTSAVYADAREVQVTFQLKNNVSWDTIATSQRRSVTVRVEPNGQLAVSNAAAVGVQSCPNLPDGMCAVSVTLATGYFSYIAGSNDVSVYGGFTDAWTESSVLLGNTTVVSVAPRTATQIDALFVGNTPMRDLFVGDSFTLRVSSLLRRYVDSLELTIEVSDGLRIVSGGSVTLSGSAVFIGAFSINQANGGTSASTSFGKSSSDTAEVQATPTEEGLLDIRLEVTSSAVAGSALSINVSVDRIRDSSGSSIDTASGTIFAGRDGITTTGVGRVYVGTEVLSGVLVYVDRGEVLNMAAVTGNIQTYAAQATAVYSTGRRSDVSSSSDLTLESLSPMVVGTSGRSVVLSSAHEGGDAQARVNVSYRGFSRVLSMRVLVLFDVAVSVGRMELAPVQGWFTDTTCEQRYSSTQVVVSASYGVSPLLPPVASSVDISSIAALTLQSSNPAVGSVGATGVVTGVGTGSTTVLLQHMPSVNVTIDVTSTHVTMDRLDVWLVGSIGISRVTAGAIVPHTEQEYRIVRTAPELRLEGDEATVVAVAVLSDGSSIPLSAANGLNLTSNFPSTVLVSSQVNQRVRVPADPEENSGELVSVRWQPGSDCAGAIDLEVGLDMDVSPPAATGVAFAATQTTLVPAGGAAQAAGYPTTSQLSVGLLFPGGRRQDGLQGDARTVYTIDWDDAVDGADLFTIDNTTGRITAAAAAFNRTGGATVTVSFTTHNVSATVRVFVTNFAVMEITANPYPTYGGSGSEAVTSLHAIEDTVPQMYEQAVFTLTMYLMDGRRTTVGGTYSVRSGSSGNATGTFSGNVLTVGGDGAITVDARFGGSDASVGYTVTVSPSAVRVQSITSMRMIQNSRTVTTVSGVRDAATGQVAFGVVMSNGRRITNAVSSSGAFYLRGMFSFNSSTPSALTIDAASAVATLVGNHYTGVTVSVTIGSSQRVVGGSTISVFCNLDTTDLGDVDLGQASGAPIAPQSVGTFFTVPVRVNTGSNTLGAFSIRLEYDEDDLVVNDSTVFPIRGGSLEDVTTITANYTLLAGTILNSRVRGTDELLAVLTMRTLRAGIIRLGGITVSLEDDEIRSDQFASLIEIDAGAIEFESRTSRRLRGRDITSSTSTYDTRSGSASRRTRERRGAQTRRQTCTPGSSAAVRGDVDCNCRFSPGDSLYVHNYVAARRQDFEVAGGTLIQNTLSTCAHTLQALDADKSGVIDAADAKFLLQVIGQQRHFVSLNFTSTGASAIGGGDNCTSLLSAHIEGADGTAPFTAGYRVLFLFGPQTETFVDFFNTSLGSAGVSEGSLVSFVDNTDQAVSVDGRLWMLEGVRLEDEYSFGVTFPNTIDVREMAVSLIVVTETFQGARGVLYAGVEPRDTGSAEYGRLDVDIEVGSETATVRSIGTFGFNARYDVVQSVDTAACKVAAGICDSLPCSGADAFLNGSCTASEDSVCVPRQVCEPPQISGAPITPTTDRECVGNTSSTATLVFTSSGTTSASASSQSTVSTSTHTATTLLVNTTRSVTHVGTTDIVSSSTDPVIATVVTSDPAAGPPTVHLPTETTTELTDVGTTTASNADGQSDQSSTAESTGSNNGVIIAIVVVLLLLFLLCIVIVVFRSRRGRNPDKIEPDLSARTTVNVMYDAGDSRTDGNANDNLEELTTISAMYAAQNGDEHVGDDDLDAILGLMPKGGPRSHLAPSSHVSETEVDDNASAHLIRSGTTASSTRGPLRQLYLPQNTNTNTDRGDFVADISVYDAVEKGDHETLKKLLEAGMSPDDVVDSNGLERKIPLQLAMQRNDVTACRLLLFLDVTTSNEKIKKAVPERATAALHFWAKLDGEGSLLDVLLEAQADIDGFGNNERQSAVYTATESGSMGALKLLLEKGANVFVRKQPSERSVLHAAVVTSNVDMVDFLCWSCPAIVDATDADGSTALHAAAQAGDAEIIIALLEAGARVEKEDLSGNSPFEALPPRLQDLLRPLLLPSTLKPNEYRDLAPEGRGTGSLRKMAGYPIMSPDVLKAVGADGEKLEQLES
eukprot:m.1225127 g.1225127  ORF g.1225127 m.1225127 type:complete len:2466 (+) comp24628_c0_seq2:373-7770(+)